MAYTDYQISDITAVPFEGAFTVNSATYYASQEIDNPMLLEYDGKQIHVIRWNSNTNRLILELAQITDTTVSSLGNVEFENVTDPRSNDILKACIDKTEESVMDYLYDRCTVTLNSEIEECLDMIEYQFNFLALKQNFLICSDWIMLPDSGATPEEFEAWKLWRQSIRDMQSSGDPATDVRNLSIPVPPSSDDRFGRSITEPVENFAVYQKSLKDLEIFNTLNITPESLTKEEFLRDGPKFQSDYDAEYFTEHQFFSKYTA
jgi:hypothetical protein